MSKVGIYVRYSSIDVLVGEDSISRSINNQIEILTKYAYENKLEVYKIYSDYNKTGTNMDRPGLQELLKDSVEGKLDTILVKDLSRFGRNYLEVAQYVDKIFPELGIRFISINDDLDSSNYKDDLSIALKSYINHMYAKDVAKKIRESFQLRAETEPLCTKKYGYIIEKKNITIDPYSSKIVTKIFELAAEGKKPKEIIAYLEENKVLIPSAYLATIQNKEYKGNDPYTWTHDKLTRILNDRAYMGEFINFKEGNRSKSAIETNIIVPFPKIISEELFNKAPKSFSRWEGDKEVRSNHLTKFIRCVECRERVLKRQKKSNNMTYSPRIIKDCDCYICYSCRTTIPAAQFEKRIYNELKSAIKAIASDINKYVESLSIKMELDERPMNPEEIHEQMRSLFEMYMAGTIKRSDYEKRQSELSAKLFKNEIKLGFNAKMLTTYDLRNRVIRYLNSIDYKEEDHLKFIRENAREVRYSKLEDKITFIFPFMEE